MQPQVEEIKLKLTDKFETAFPDKLIPSNSYLDKSKTGLGMTYAEFHANRHSIIVIPYTSIIELKVKDYKHRNTFKIVDEVKAPAIEAYLKCSKEHKKLVTTPEGFKKIIDAAISMGKIEWLYREFFCLLDEAHCYAVDAFRKYILTPFDHFWKFKNKALGTATYYPYSDPRFATLKHYKITFNKKFGKVIIVDNEDPKAVLNDFLTNPEQFPGNVHIFYNSVKEIEKVIRTAVVTEVVVYCRDEERNHKTLADQSVYFKNEPCSDDYKKFNFYSLRYYDGWDLFDNDQATIILVTDVKVKHSLVGIPYNGFQAIGRLRKVLPHKIYHITNNFGKEDKDVRSFDHISKNWYYQANSHVQYYNDFKIKAAKDGMEEKRVTARFVEPYCKFTKDTNEAYVYPMKVDQHTCREYSREGYANIITIEKHWIDMNYDTKVKYSDLKPLLVNGVAKATVNKQVVSLIKEYRKYPERYLYHKSKMTFNKLCDNYRTVFIALDVLGEDEMILLGYDDKKMEAELVKRSNSNLDEKLKARIKEDIIPDTPYTTEQSIAVLQKAYDDLGYKNPEGGMKLAKAMQIEKLNIFIITKTQIKDPDGTINTLTGKVKRIPAWKFSELPNSDLGKNEV